VKRKAGGQETWTRLRVGQGFEQFLGEQGHYPSALEVDACSYLCSSRQIQRKFGGLPELRRLLGISEISYAVGEPRKKIALRVNRLSMTSEREISEYLTGRYGEICVHEEKKYGSGRNRVDFFVYAKKNFAVEVFNTYTVHGIIGNLNPKLKKYVDFPHTIFFVITGGDFSQAQIDKVVSRKRIFRLKPQMKCVCFDELKNLCSRGFEPLRMSYRLL
jgi:hypothetical protein